MKKTIIKNNKRTINNIAWNTIKASLNRIKEEQNEDLAWEFFHKGIIEEFLNELHFKEEENNIENSPIRKWVRDRITIFVCDNNISGYVMILNNNGSVYHYSYTRDLLFKDKDLVELTIQDSKIKIEMSLSKFIIEVIDGIRAVWVYCGPQTEDRI